MQESIKEIFDAPGFAAAYEEKTEKANWMGPEVMFGMSYIHLRPGEKLLDLGIGTGLCGRLFHHAGLRIYGLDISAEMLKIAAAKQFAVELKEHDLSQTPYPYADESMDHAICGGVMHIFADPSPIIREAARIIRHGGIFVFCCLDAFHGKDGETGHCKHQRHAHSREFIDQTLTACGLELCRTLSFTVDMHPGERDFRAYLAKKTYSR